MCGLKAEVDIKVVLKLCHLLRVLFSINESDILNIIYNTLL